MTPLELLARIAAILPPPRFPLIRFHGVLDRLGILHETATAARAREATDDEARDDDHT